MSIGEERMRILTMLQEGKINATEAAELLDAVGKGEVAPTPPPVTYNKNKMLHVHVVDGDNTKVNVNVPLQMLETLIKLGVHFIPDDPDLESLKGINLEEVLQMVRAGMTGRLVEVDDEDTHVVIDVD
jgi:hypothetical protein